MDNKSAMTVVEAGSPSDSFSKELGRSLSGNLKFCDGTFGERLGLYGHDSRIPVEGTVIVKLLSLLRIAEDLHSTDQKTIKNLRIEKKALLKSMDDLKDAAETKKSTGDKDEADE